MFLGCHYYIKWIELNSFDINNSKWQSATARFFLIYSLQASIFNGASDQFSGVCNLIASFEVRVNICTILQCLIDNSSVNGNS